MSWLDTLKGALVEEDPKPTASIAPLSSSSSSFQNAVSSTVSAPIPIPIATPVPSDTFLVKLRSKLATPGSAVEKFETAYNSLGAIADPSLRLTSTLAALKSMAGVETQALLQEYAARRQQLDAEVQTFAGVIAGQRKADVDDKQAQISGIDSQIQALSVQRQSLAAAMADAKAKLERSQAGFDAAVATVRGEIESAVNRLKGSA
jgi:hypothetical protein